MRVLFVVVFCLSLMQEINTECFETLAEWSCDKIISSSLAGGVVLLLYAGLLLRLSRKLCL